MSALVEEHPQNREAPFFLSCLLVPLHSLAEKCVKDCILGTVVVVW